MYKICNKRSPTTADTIVEICDELIIPCGHGGQTHTICIFNPRFHDDGTYGVNHDYSVLVYGSHCLDKVILILIAMLESFITMDHRIIITPECQALRSFRSPKLPNKGT